MGGSPPKGAVQSEVPGQYPLNVVNGLGGGGELFRVHVEGAEHNLEIIVVDLDGVQGAFGEGELGDFHGSAFNSDVDGDPVGDVLEQVVSFAAVEVDVVLFENVGDVVAEEVVEVVVDVVAELVGDLLSHLPLLFGGELGELAG